jgi:hypothetical protein
VELLLGAGGSRDKRLHIPGQASGWTELVTLDINPDHRPDVLHDLNERPLPFDDNTFNEVHAYEVLEHLGRQGDYRTFFAEWEEWWRILKPGAVFAGTSPMWNSPWAFGDPGHTRVISLQSLVFLDRMEYVRQVGKTPMTDYRFCYRADFEIIHCRIHEHTFEYGLRAVKPARP